ncbi:MAG TPA: glycine cleavage system protein GcvH [Blastocatellia bacterium]|nr:glycine cleavage system protein GcvH [Blastocatellia bacterium]
MAKYPDNLQYTKDHEWLKIEGDLGRAGITEFAQEALGDIVYVELPKIGEKFSAGEPFGSVESVKSVNEIFIPVSGEVVEINEVLADSPELVNEDPYGKGWMIRFRITDSSEVDSLLSSSEYEDFISEQEH